MTAIVCFDLLPTALGPMVLASDGDALMGAGFQGQRHQTPQGPSWQRRRNLATLVIHTAGTRHSAVTVPHLDAEDAQRLRDLLGRQIDHDDDA